MEAGGSTYGLGPRRRESSDALESFVLGVSALLSDCQRSEADLLGHPSHPCCLVKIVSSRVSLFEGNDYPPKRLPRFRSRLIVDRHRSTVSVAADCEALGRRAFLPGLFDDRFGLSIEGLHLLEVRHHEPFGVSLSAHFAI